MSRALKIGVVRQRVAGWVAGILLLPVAVDADPLERVANTTLQMPAEAPISGYGLESAFGMTFDQPVAIVTPPGETGRVFVVERHGRIMVVDITGPQAGASVFLDLRSRVNSLTIESGLLGLAFHPDYANNGYFYVYRTSYESTAASPHHLHDVIARYSVSPDDPGRALPGSELRIMAQLDGSAEHNAGDLKFGPDGYLYFSIGDYKPGLVDASSNPQAIDRGLFGGIFRIDVDLRPDSLVPNPHYSVTGNYAIPPGNPFVGVTGYHGVAVDPGEVRMEYYALGFRNPWRMTFHPVTGELYVGDVGNASWEEIDRVEKGGNYGWPYREAGIQQSISGPGSGQPSLAPIVAIPHGRGQYEGNSVIGGVFYMGEKIPALSGAFVYGDHRAGHIWALWPDGRTNLAPENWMASKFGISCFGLDPSNGDVLIGNVDTGEIDRLVYIDPAEAEPFPQTLSDTGIFADLDALTPNPGVVPYDINLRFWSDNAIKTRWFSLPDPETKIAFSPDGNWGLPQGSVWVKHFDIEMVQGDAASLRRLETRVIVKTAGGIYGVTYRWQPGTGNATLVPPEGMDETLTISEGNRQRQQVWRYPGRGECATCHTRAGGHALGFNTPQMNRDVVHGGAEVDQIEALRAAGYFESFDGGTADLRRLVPVGDERHGLHERARSYLAANCSFCHQAGTLVDFWDGRIQLPFAEMNFSARVLQPNHPEESLLHRRMSTPGVIRMPPIGSNVVDAGGTDLISRWIQNFPEAPWEQAVLGRPLRDGSASVGEDLIEVSGAGDAGDAVSGQFLHQPASGSTLLTVRLDGQYARSGVGSAGILFRGAGRAASVGLSAAGVAAVSLWDDPGVTPRQRVELPALLDSEPHWLRLKREGSAVSAATKGLAGDWRAVGTGNIELGGQLEVGLVSASDQATEINVAKFAQFGITTISLDDPAASRSYVAGDTVPLLARVAESGASAVSRVEFFSGGELIGSAAAAPYAFGWEHVLAGSHSIVAVAYDVLGGPVSSSPVTVTVAYPEAGAVALGLDAATGGGWQGRYGGEGYLIAGVIGQGLAAGASVSLEGATPGLWADLPDPSRALVDPSTGQPASGFWEAAEELSLRVGLQDGAWHEVALYFFDPEEGRRGPQVVFMRPAGGGDTLLRYELPDYYGGMYVKLRVRGEVEIIIESQGGNPALLSGVFFDEVSNLAPTVGLASPADGAVLTLPHPVLLSADAADDEGVVAVEFYANNSLLYRDEEAPFEFQWSGMLAGGYSISARAEDALGAKTDSATSSITLRNPIASASFIGSDDLTQGNWRPRYGSEGFEISGREHGLPPQYRLNVAGADSYAWSSPAIADMRALLLSDGSARVMSPWFDQFGFSMDIDLDDGLPHEVSFYVIDWFGYGWRTNVRVIDPVTGVVLDARDYDPAAGGRYLRWALRGNVRFEFSSIFGHAMVAGLFIDPVTAPVPEVRILNPSGAVERELDDGVNVTIGAVSPSSPIAKVELFDGPRRVAEWVEPPYVARWRPEVVGDYELTARVTNMAGGISDSPVTRVRFVSSTLGAAAIFDGEDRETKGTWIGRYGDEGYLVVNDVVESIPPYAVVTPSGQSATTWQSTTGDLRGLQRKGASGRTAAAWYSTGSFEVCLDTRDGDWHHVALYFMDWGNGRAFDVDLVDGVSGALLDRRAVSEFQEGRYLRWYVKGKVTARFTTRAASAVLSGLFFQEVSGFDDWRLKHFTADERGDPVVSSPGSNPDGDDLPNLLEYKMGGDPWSWDRGPGIEISPAGGATLTWDQAPYAGDVRIEVEGSPDLVGWTPATGLPGGMSVEALGARDRLTLPLPAAGYRFFRLRATPASAGQ